MILRRTRYAVLRTGFSNVLHISTTLYFRHIHPAPGMGEGDVRVAADLRSDFGGGFFHVCRGTASR